MRERTRRWLPFYALITVSAVLLAGLVYAFYLAPKPGTGIPSTTPGPPATSVEIDSIDLIFTYVVAPGGNQSYLEPAPDCLPCPVNVTAGTVWNFTFGLNNTDRATHHITAIGVDAPFTLESVQPRLPVTIKGGGNVSLTLTIHAPNMDGAYSIQGSITSD